MLRSRDRQFILLLAVDILVYVFCNAMLAVVIIREQLTQYHAKWVTQAEVGKALRNIGQFSSHVLFCISC